MSESARGCRAAADAARGELARARTHTQTNTRISAYARPRPHTHTPCRSGQRECEGFRLAEGQMAEKRRGEVRGGTGCLK